MGGGRGKGGLTGSPDIHSPRITKVRRVKRRRIAWILAVDTEVLESEEEEATQVIVKRQRKGGKPEQVAAEAFSGSVAEAVKRGCELIERDAAELSPHL